MRQRTGTTAILVAAATSSVMLLAGCGQNDAGSASPPSRTTSGSASASASASPPSSASPTPRTTKVVQLKAGSSVEMPRSWQADPEDDGVIIFGDRDGRLTCVLSDIPGSPEDLKPTKKTISSMAHDAMPNEPNNRRAPDAIVHGVRMYHLIGKDEGAWHDEFGTIDHGHLVRVEFAGNLYLSQRSWQVKQIAKVMKTFRLR